jgi:FAD/FMN-containing dehydrogenase
MGIALMRGSCAAAMLAGMTLATLTPFHTLRRHLDGPCIDRDHAGWDAATQAFNLAVLQEPAAVVFPAHERDVMAVVDFARDYGLQVAPRRTGHNAEPLGAMDDVILVRTDALRGVEIDFARRRARVRAGSTWAQVIPAASELGLAALHGSTPDVSVAGYALGGGVGWYARRLGLAANSIAAIELVTADGRLRRVDHEHDPELFWALRGGGGNFGIVTALELELYHLPEVYAGALFFDSERASDVLHAWLDWTGTVPDEVTSVGRIMQLRGRRLAVVEAVVVGDEYDGAEWLRPLRALGPEADTFDLMAPAGIAELHMDPRDPLPYAGSSQVLGRLGPAALDAFVEAAGPGSGSPLTSAEIRHAGGAAARPQPGQGALGTVDAEFLTFAVGTVFDEETHRAVRERLERIEGVFAPYDAGRLYTPEACERLRAVKAAVDPDEVIRANHPIPPLD